MNFSRGNLCVESVTFSVHGCRAVCWNFVDGWTIRHESEVKWSKFKVTRKCKNIEKVIAIILARLCAKANSGLTVTGKEPCLEVV